MFINIKNLFSIPNPRTLPLLLVLKQAQKKDLSLEIASLVTSDEDLETLEKEGYIKYIKGKSKDNIMQRMRLDKKGTTFLNKLQNPEIEKGDIQMFDYLCKMYLNNEDDERHIGNKKKTLEYCTEFRQLLDLSLYQMYWLCWFFLEEFTHTKKLEYIFFNSNKNRYSTFKNNMEDSPLFQFYEERIKEVKKLWERKIK